MKIGSVCFATERGLGYLAKSFYDNGVVTDVTIIRHSSIPTQKHWYPNATEITSTSYTALPQMQEWLRSLDIAVFFETPFDWEVFKFCRDNGVKTALMTMYECTPEHRSHHPDLYLCPSLLDLEFFPEPKVFIPVPVDIPWQLRKEARVFVHNAGYIGLKGRNGTLELLKAMQFVDSDIKLLVRSQSPELHQLARQVPTVKRDSRVELFVGQVPYDELRAGCDVCIAPEKWNGLSLPLQESRAAGLLVMTTNRYPFNTWLPREPLIHVKGYQKQRLAGRLLEFDECVLEPKDIALKIDEWCGKDISDYSRSGLEWAKTMSWDALKPRYIAALENLL